MQGIESRVLFLGFDHQSDSLALGEAADGGNPLKDVRVRQAIYQAIDAEAIVERIMRGNAQEAALLIAPGVDGYRAEDDIRLPTNPEAAKTLLAEIGYGEGFKLTLRCPNDRYVNDEAICTAIVPMLARIGVEVTLDAVPVSQYWTELREGRFDMYLLGWSPGTFDAEHPIRFLMHTPDAEKKLGSWNFGGYSNPDIDELLPMIQQELDPEARQAMIDAVHAILKNDVVYVPLLVQPLVWAMRSGVSMRQRPDNFLILRWVTVAS
jgi:peptide/nickel transport system substrate-binding protein